MKPGRGKACCFSLSPVKELVTGQVQSLLLLSQPCKGASDWTGKKLLLFQTCKGASDWTGKKLLLSQTCKGARDWTGKKLLLSQSSKGTGDWTGKKILLSPVRELVTGQANALLSKALMWLHEWLRIK